MPPEAPVRERLFEPFMDPVDMVACFPSGATLREIEEASARHGLRFPLACEPGATLAEHLSRMEYASCSARFGAYVDNVLGMNWRLPGGSVARVGERVVKSTTGYDLQRFLLHSRSQLGHATHYVLRLRPWGEGMVAARFTGEEAALDAVASILRRSPWAHWLDSVDLVLEAGEATRMEISANCLEAEQSVYADFFKGLARETGAVLKMKGSHEPAAFPDLCIKEVPDRCPELARKCLGAVGGKARVLLLNGYVHLHPERPADPEWIRSLQQECAASGGHVYGKAVSGKKPGELEHKWIEELERKWGAI